MSSAPREQNQMVRFERDQLARDLRESVARRDALDARVRALSADLARARRDAEEAQVALDERERRLGDVERELAEIRARRDDERAAKLARQRRQLLANLRDTQAELEAAVARVEKARDSRWHALGGMTWQVRRSGKLLLAAAGAVALLVAAIAIAIAAPGAWWAGVLALLGSAAIFTVAGREAWRRQVLAEARWRRRFALSTVVDVDEEDVTLPDPKAATAATVERIVERRLVPNLAVTGAAEERWLTGSTRAEPGQMRVAAVLDEISELCLGPECRLMTMGPGDWRARLEANPPHLLLVESAWNGNGGAWRDAIASSSSGREKGLPSMRAMVAWCRENGIPTAFWNKEDPVHFERFRDAAALFDHVFTTDADRVEAYRALPSDSVKTVTPLPFAAQPRLHNPIGGSGPRDPRPAFAGTYYRTRHEARRGELEMLLDAARPYGLVIYDRMHGSEGEAYGFPERFAEHVRGRLSFREVCDAYRRHALFLNVNSVTDSPTMCSRRVFELLACGTPVVSTRSQAIQALLGDLVPIVGSGEEATAVLDRLLQDDSERRRLGDAGRREVLGRHTYGHRLDTILRVAGFDIAEPAGRRVGAILVADDSDSFAKLVEDLAGQTRAPDEILVGVHPGVAVDGGLARLEQAFPNSPLRLVHQAPDTPASESTRQLAALCSTPWVAPLAQGARYPAQHLELLMHSTAFAAADVIGGGDPAGSPVAPLHSFVDVLEPAAAIATRDRVAAAGWPASPDGLHAWFRSGARLYRADTTGVLPPAGSAKPSALRRSRRRGVRRPV